MLFQNVLLASARTQGIDPNAARRGAMRLRDSMAWNTLQRELMDSQAGRVANATPVVYAAGGSFGMSRPALQALVRSECMRKVGALTCHPMKCVRSFGPFRKLGLHMHEDANVGLCMHLHRARLLTCSCFQMGMATLPLPKPFRPSVAAPLSKGAVAKSPPPMTAEALVAGLKDGTAAAPLCRHPLALHPLLTATDFVGWWRAIELRDAYYAASIRVFA